MLSPSLKCDRLWKDWNGVSVRETLLWKDM